MIEAKSWLIDPARLATAWDGEVPALAFVATDRLEAGPIVLPPCPVIGVGDVRHPAASRLDAVIEAPVSIARIVEQVTGHPLAAAAVVQVLRAIEGLAVADALTVESMAYAMLQGSAEHAAWRDARAAADPSPPGRVIVAREGDTLRIVVDRPGARNAIDRGMRDALFEAFTLAAIDPDIARVEWRAAGAAFGVGADLAEFGTTRDPASAHAIRARTLPAHPLSRCGARVHVHVRGACIGASLEMAAFAGRVTASRGAWFQLPELAMGVLPGAGGCASVPRRIGRHRAALMILSGRRIDAATALRWGLIDAVMDEAAADPGGPDAD